MYNSNKKIRDKYEIQGVKYYLTNIIKVDTITNFISNLIFDLKEQDADKAYLDELKRIYQDLIIYKDEQKNMYYDIDNASIAVRILHSDISRISILSTSLLIDIASEFIMDLDIDCKCSEILIPMRNYISDMPVRDMVVTLVSNSIISNIYTDSAVHKSIADIIKLMAKMYSNKSTKLPEPILMTFLESIDFK